MLFRTSASFCKVTAETTKTLASVGGPVGWGYTGSYEREAAKGETESGESASISSTASSGGTSSFTFATKKEEDRGKAEEGREKGKGSRARSTRGLDVVSCPDWTLARGRRSPFTGNPAALLERSRAPCPSSSPARQLLSSFSPLLSSSRPLPSSVLHLCCGPAAEASSLVRPLFSFNLLSLLRSLNLQLLHCCPALAENQSWNLLDRFHRCYLRPQVHGGLTSGLLSWV